MKKITLLSIITLISFGVNAQSLLPTKYGVKVGLNIANITSTPNEGVKNIETTPLLGVAGGFYMEIALNDKWYINPELLYVQKGTSFNYDFTHDYAVNQRDTHYLTNNTLTLSFIEVNPTISYKASEKLALNFGPSLSYLVQSAYDTNEKNTNNHISHEILEESIFSEESLDIALNIGASYYFSENFLIEGKINTGFMSIGKVSQEIFNGDSSNESKSKIWELKSKGIIFSIAYLF